MFWLKNQAMNTLPQVNIHFFGQDMYTLMGSQPAQQGYKLKVTNST